MGSFFVDTKTVLECSAYDASPWLILIGLITLVFAVMYVGYHFGKPAYAAFIGGYMKDQKTRGAKSALRGLLLSMVRHYRPLSIVITLLLFGVYFAVNAVFALTVLIRSNCF